MKKVVLGIFVSCVFVYFTIRGVDFGESLAALTDAKYMFMLLAILLIFTTSVLRSIRWGVLLSPLETIDQKILYPVTCIGYMAIVVLPLRIGEFVRPYLIQAKSGIPMGSSLGTVFVERMLDLLTLLGILSVVVLISDLPTWLTKTSYSIMPIFGFLVLLIFFIYFKNEFTMRLLNPVLNWVPDKIRLKIETLLKNFIDGFHIIADPKRFLYSVFLSIFIWAISGLSIYSLFYSLNLQLSIVSAFVVLIVTILGISLPTAPGMLGNFQIGCIVALTFFNVQKNDAFLFSMVNYFIAVGLNIVLGLMFLPTIDISYREIKKTLSECIKY